MRKGQGSVAILIIIILGVLIGILLLMPEEERRKLLNETNVTEDEEVVRVLLSESPGLVYPAEKRTDNHSISSVNLFTTVETEVSNLANSLQVSRNIFQDKYQSFSFKLKDLAEIETVSLVFLIKESRGNLILRLNGREVYNRRATVNDLPIELPTMYLRESNDLEIACSSPGWMFLSTNLYDLRDVKIIKKYKVEQKRARRDFVISSAEKAALEKAELKYSTYCMTVTEKGTLKILLNKKLISMHMVVCDAREIELDVPIDNLVSGRNLLEFEIDKGDYIVEQIELVTELEKEYHPRYEFYIEEDEFEDIEKGDLKVKMYMDFYDNERRKATILINGNRIYLDTRRDSYSEDISEIVREGENYVKIIAKTEFEIVDFGIKLEE